MDGVGLWDGDLRMEGEERNGEIGGAILKTGLDDGRSTTGYLVKKELQRDLLREKAGNRA